MNPDVYRGIWGGKNCRDSPVQALRECSCSTHECEAKTKYLEQLDEVYQYSIPRKRAAAFFAESMQGVGGAVQFPKGYIQGAYNMIKEYGGLFVSDEVKITNKILFILHAFCRYKLVLVEPVITFGVSKCMELYLI